MGGYDRPLQGVVWLPHMAPGCGWDLFRGLLRGAVVRDLGRGRRGNRDAGQRDGGPVTYVTSRYL